MTARTLTIAGFAVLAVAAAALALAGRRRRLGLVPAGALLDSLRSLPPTRFALVLAWVWLGWHVLAR